MKNTEVQDCVHEVVRFIPSNFSFLFLWSYYWSLCIYPIGSKRKITGQFMKPLFRERSIQRFGNYQWLLSGTCLSRETEHSNCLVAALKGSNLFRQEPSTSDATRTHAEIRCGAWPNISSRSAPQEKRRQEDLLTLMGGLYSLTSCAAAAARHTTRRLMMMSYRTGGINACAHAGQPICGR